MNFSILKIQILKALRAEVSQAEMSRRLGYKHNQIYRWEAERTNFSWRNFVDFTTTCEAPLAGALKKCFVFNGDPKRHDLLMRHILGHSKQSDIANQIGCSVFSLSRMLNYRANPNLEQMLQLINVCTHSLFEFLDHIVGAENLPLIADEFQRRRDERTLYYTDPRIGIIIRCFELSEYTSLPTHREGFIADKLGIPLEEERKILNIMLTSGLINFDGGWFKPTNKALDTLDNFSKTLDLHKYWIEKQLEAIAIYQKLGKTIENGGSGYILFSANQQTYEKIKKSFTQFFTDLNSHIMHADNQNDLDRVVAANLFLIDPIQLKKFGHLK